MNDYTEYMAFATELADVARQVTLSYFRLGSEIGLGVDISSDMAINIDVKIDGSPVTIADRETEAILREKITQRFPHHGIIGEEQSAKNTNSEFKWIIDPIDGTKNFIAGLPLYGTLICLLENDRPVIGIIDIPAQNERWIASCQSKTQYRRGDASNSQHSNDNNDSLVAVVSTKNNKTLQKAILCSTDYSMFSQAENAQVKSLRRSVSSIRYNGDCYLYAMLASGWIDIVLEADLQVYDFLPLILIVEQAGGVISDWQGKPLSRNSSGQVIACANLALHQSALSQLAISNDEHEDTVI